MEFILSCSTRYLTTERSQPVRDRVEHSRRNAPMYYSLCNLFPLFLSEINECDSNPCQHNSTCYDLINDFLCTCQPGYTAKQCQTNIDDCQEKPCFNNGTCQDLVNNYTCKCTQGYQGFNCENDIDECISSPCSNNASCRNVPGSYTCQCSPGYTCLLYTSPNPRDQRGSRMPSSA